MTTADGYAEREAAKLMVGDAVQVKDDPEIEITLGADKGYDAKEFIDALTDMKVTPHVAQNTSGRTHQAESQQCPMRLQALRGTPSRSKRES